MCGTKNEGTPTIFFPYYINQSRLLDLYALINGGYSEYEEVGVQSTSGNKRTSDSKVSGAAGFKMFKIGASASSNSEVLDSGEFSSTQKVVQTPATMLESVISWLDSHSYIVPIQESLIGSIVATPVVLKINSIKSLFNEAKEVTALAEKMSSPGGKSSSRTGKASEGKTNKIKALEQIVGVTKELFASEEIVFDSDGYSVVGSISDSGLYQATRDDIVDSELICLAQVKRKYEKGTQLLKNTVFSRLKDEEAKKGVIEAVKALANSNYDYQASVITEIRDKVVYELEVVALYKLGHSQERSMSRAS